MIVTAVRCAEYQAIESRHLSRVVETKMVYDRILTVDPNGIPRAPSIMKWFGNHRLQISILESFCEAMLRSSE